MLKKAVLMSAMLISAIASHCYAMDDQDANSAYNKSASQEVTSQEVTSADVADPAEKIDKQYQTKETAEEINRRAWNSARKDSIMHNGTYGYGL